jgi:hypothetical protein
MMRKIITVCGFFFFSMLGGAIGQNLPFNGVAIAAYQMVSVWTGAAGGTIPSWVNSQFGFNNGGQTSSLAGGTPLMSVSPAGKWAAVLASRMSDNTAGDGGYLSTLNNLCLFDNASAPVNGWCQYLQGEVLNTMNGKELIMTENSLYNQAQTSPTNIDPFNWNAGGLTNNLRLDCGYGTGQGTPQDCSNALTIIANGAPYTNPVIVVGNTALDTTAMGANPPAIAMPASYAYAGYTSAGTIGFKIFGGSGSPAGVVSCTARCLYLRTDGGAGSTLYVNETGGGTSGWAAK